MRHYFPRLNDVVTSHIQSKKTAAFVVIASVFSVNPASAEDWSFDPAMLGNSSGNVDVSLFNSGSQLPGVYTADVYLNGNKIDSQNVTFIDRKTDEGKHFLYPCLSSELLASYGVKTENYPELMKGGKCAELQAIPGSKFVFQFYSRRLLLTLPHTALRPRETGIAPRELWNEGIPAFLMNYNADITYSENKSLSSTRSSYVQLNPGANLGAWRLRNQTNWHQQNSDSGGEWETVYTYAEVGVNALHSRLTVGDRYTPGDIFDSVPFRGIMLGTDESMTPWDRRSFSPVIRGIARTEARVEVRQNGYIAYSTTVAPGPFELTDFVTPGSSAGNFDVTVLEADGSIQKFVVPYQTPAISVKQGYNNYNLMTGFYRPEYSSGDKPIGQFTIMYGFPWELTGYTGFQGAEHFGAVTAGVGLSLGEWGGVSLDITRSRGQLREQNTQTGTTWRLRYSKEIVSTNTSLILSSYQYSSSGYIKMTDVLDSWDASENASVNTGFGKTKSDTTLTLSQSMKDWGAISLNATRSDYHDRSGSTTSFGGSYGLNLFRDISVNLNWSETSSTYDDKENKKDRITSVFVNVPLGTNSPINATYNLTSPSNGPVTHEAGLSGQGFNEQLSWNMRQRYTSESSQRNSDTSSLYMDWSGRYGNVGGSYSYSPAQRSMGASISGGAIGHSEGITFGQSLGETNALILTPGASGVGVYGGRGVKTDFRGYTTTGFLTPYQENAIMLDPMYLPDDADVIQTSVKVVPTKGAVVPARFSVRSGGKAMMTILRSSNQFVPFGSIVIVENIEGNAGIVGENGQVYLTGLPDKGRLKVKWADNECSVVFRLPENKNMSGLYNMKGVCS